jgi:3-dehydroquinate dehydratase-1
MRLTCKHPVQVKGCTIGGDAPLICLPLVAKDKKDLLAQAEASLPQAPDLLEWRVDGFEGVTDIEASLEALRALAAAIDPVPMIYTCRIDKEGGMCSLAPDRRLELITAAIETGLPDIVDIELCNAAAFIETVMEAAAASGIKVILSSHYFEETPDEGTILGRLTGAQEAGAHIAKVAVMPRNYQDVLVLLSATLKARSGAVEIPIVTISMGAEGGITRLAGGLFGADITFAVGNEASAPGQIPIGELRQAMAVIYAESLRSLKR